MIYAFIAHALGPIIIFCFWTSFTLHTIFCLTLIRWIWRQIFIEFNAFKFCIFGISATFFTYLSYFLLIWLWIILKKRIVTKNSFIFWKCNFFFLLILIKFLIWYFWTCRFCDWLNIIRLKTLLCIWNQWFVKFINAFNFLRNSRKVWFNHIQLIFLLILHYI